MTNQKKNVRKNTKNEYEKLKELVRNFLIETECVPFRNADCEQVVVYNLLSKLRKAVEE